MKAPSSAALRLTDFLVFAPFALSALGLFLSDSHSDDENSKGLRAFRKKNYEEARAAFSRAIDKATDKNYLNAEACLNLGLARDKAGAPLQALKAYFFVSENFSGGRKGFESLFNQGELNGRLGLKEAALLKYQQALDFETDEKKIKENIEALFLPENQKSGEGGKKGPHDSAKKPGAEEESLSKEKNGDSSPQTKEESAGPAAGGRSEKPDSSDNAEDKASNDKKEQNMPKEQQGRAEGNPDGQSGKAGGPEEDTSGAGGSETEPGGGGNETSSETTVGAKGEGAGKRRRGAFEEAPARAILDSLEQQETDVRRRIYRQKNLREKRRRPPGGKDW